MPTTLSYPGVYVEETPSSVRTGPQVSTATVAFVGYARQGPLNQPVRVTSFAEYERHFGGLTGHVSLSYAAYQFFLNGGASAVVVRVIREGSVAPAAVTLHSHEWHENPHRAPHRRESLTPPGTGDLEETGSQGSHERHAALEIAAREPGCWGDDLRVVVDYATRHPRRTFNLQVIRVAGGLRGRESFHGLSMDPDHARYAPAVIDAESEFIRVRAVGTHRPEPSGTISRSLEHEPLDLDVDIRVQIGGVERDFHLYHPERDEPPPGTLFDLAALLEHRLRALPDPPGRPVFSRAEVRVLGSRLQTLAGSFDEDDVVHFHGAGAQALGLEEFASPPARALRGGDDGDPPQAGDLIGSEAAKTGLQSLRDVDDVNLINLPDLAGFAAISEVVAVLSSALPLCRERRCFLLVDSPASWRNVDAARSGIRDFEEVRSDHAGLYFPHLLMTDPVSGRVLTVPPGGAVAGVIARTDTERGVWKAPAGTAANLLGARGLAVPLTDRESGLLNPLAVNVLRSLPGTGPVVWGARTLGGTSLAMGERLGNWSYVPVRRLALHVEESVYRGLRWVVFEPNTEQLWRQIRLDVAAYLDTLFRRGAFAGQSPRASYFVRCDATTTTATDIANGVVNVVVGIAPVTPAEFVVVRIQQSAGSLVTS